MKKLKNNVPKIHLFDNCKYYYGDCEYDTTGCTSECINSDGCCRCKKILNARVENIDYREIAKDVSLFIEIDSTSKTAENILYAVEKYIKNTISSDSFDINIIEGYYGEEIDSIKLNCSKANEFINFAKQLVGKRNTEILKLASTLEHGQLLKDHENICDVKIYSITLKDLINKLVITNHNPDINKISELMVDKKLNNLIVIKDNNKKLKLIDGHHRFQAILNNLFDIYYTKAEIFNQKSLLDVENRLKKLKKVGKLQKKITVSEIIIENSIEELNSRIQKLEDIVFSLSERLDNVEGRDYH